MLIPYPTLVLSRTDHCQRGLLTKVLPVVIFNTEVKCTGTPSQVIVRYNVVKLPRYIPHKLQYRVSLLFPAYKYSVACICSTASKSEKGYIKISKAELTIFL